MLSEPSYIHDPTISNGFDTYYLPKTSPNIANVVRIAFLGTQALHLSWRCLAILAVTEATTAAAVATVDSHMMLGDILAALAALLGIPMVPEDVDRSRYVSKLTWELNDVI